MNVISARVTAAATTAREIPKADYRGDLRGPQLPRDPQDDRRNGRATMITLRDRYPVRVAVRR